MFVVGSPRRTRLSYTCCFLSTAQLSTAQLLAFRQLLLALCLTLCVLCTYTCCGFVLVLFRYFDVRRGVTASYAPVVHLLLSFHSTAFHSTATGFSSVAACTVFDFVRVVLCILFLHVICSLFVSCCRWFARTPTCARTLIVRVCVALSTVTVFCCFRRGHCSVMSLYSLRVRARACCMRVRVLVVRMYVCILTVLVLT